MASATSATTAAPIALPMMSTLRQREANRRASLLPWGRFRCPVPDIKPQIWVLSSGQYQTGHCRLPNRQQLESGI